MAEANLLAARFYKLAEGDREQAARDWEQKVKEVADLIELYTFEAQKCSNELASNKAYLIKRRKNVENVPKM